MAETAGLIKVVAAIKLTILALLTKLTRRDMIPKVQTKEKVTGQHEKEELG